MNVVKDRLKSKTVISILHRLEAATEYDRILILENGEVVQFGTPEDVIRDSELFKGFRKGA
jgi:ABC-type multidrug transport system fused ATPase/permease subunit